jgi:hypothetical protein
VQVEFFDLEDESSPFHGATLNSAAELARIIKASRAREPYFCELVGENGYKLTIGFGKDVGCVQYSPSSGAPPYLMAMAGDENARGYVEFLAGGQPSEVPAYYCAPIELVKQIALCFLETGRASEAVRWEELGPRPTRIQRRRRRRSTKTLDVTAVRTARSKK